MVPRSNGSLTRLKYPADAEHLRQGLLKADLPNELDVRLCLRLRTLADVALNFRKLRYLLILADEPGWHLSTLLRHFLRRWHCTFLLGATLRSEFA